MENYSQSPFLRCCSKHIYCKCNLVFLILIKINKMWNIILVPIIFLFIILKFAFCSFKITNLATRVTYLLTSLAQFLVMIMQRYFQRSILYACAIILGSFHSCACADILFLSHTCSIRVVFSYVSTPDVSMRIYNSGVALLGRPAECERTPQKQLQWIF